MNDEHNTRTEAGGSGDSKPSGFGGLTDAAGLGPATPDKDFLIGRVIADITVVRLIAEGGMGRVYEGLQDKPRRPVAIKVMRPGFVSREACRRFDHEAEVLGKLRHSCIAQIYSAGIYDMMGTPVPYFVMEYIPDALPITEFARTHGLTTDQRLKLFRDVCEAVAEGHKQGIVHRDLKPSNILVEPPKAADRLGTPKIIDFGVARSIDASPEAMTGMTDMGRLIGTLQYMSPEQFVGDPAGVDVRADVYALGVILYELLAGRPPYEIRQQQIFEAARIVREQAPKPVTAANRNVRPEVVSVTETCLRKDPRQRYANAAELAGAVQACIDGLPAPLATPTKHLSDATALLRTRFGSRRTYVVAGLGILFLFAAYRGLASFWSVPPDDTGVLTTDRNTHPKVHSAQNIPTSASSLSATPLGSVSLDGAYEARKAREKRRNELVPSLLQGFPEKYLRCSLENPAYRDKENGDLVVPLQISFVRDKYFAMAKQLASLLKVDEDRCGKLVSDGTFWQSDKSVGLATSDEAARKTVLRARQRGYYGPFIDSSAKDSGTRFDRIVPVHRGWHDLFVYCNGLDAKRDTGVVVVLLVDITDDFGRSTWEWFHLSNDDYINLFGQVQTTCAQRPIDRTDMAPGDVVPFASDVVDCMTTVTTTSKKALALDVFTLSFPGLLRHEYAFTRPYWWPERTPIPFARYAVLSPLFLRLIPLDLDQERHSLAQFLETVTEKGSLIDWYVPHLFIERRIRLPDNAPSSLSIDSVFVPRNNPSPPGELKVVVNSAGMRMVRVPSGAFRKDIGGPPPGPFPTNKLGESTIAVRMEKPFWISQTEVTNEQWLAVMGEPFVPASEKHRKSDFVEEALRQPRYLPVRINYEKWNRLLVLDFNEDTLKQMREFCEKLTAMDRKKGLITAREKYALPTECQWEYAYVAGGDSVYPVHGGPYDYKVEDRKVGWLGRPDLDEGRGYPVGLLRPNPWGLFDMIGNLPEICENSKDTRRQSGETSDDAAFKKRQDNQFVLRGRSCFSSGNPYVGGLRIVRVDTSAE